MEITGDSGRIYVVDQTLQDRGDSFGRIYLATNDSRKYVLKEVPKENYERRLNIYHILGSRSECLRGLEDTVKERTIFVHKYLDTSLLSLVQKGLSLEVTKQILKAVLRGLVTLHENDIVHNEVSDIKANNILMDTRDDADGIIVQRTQLVDLETTAHLPPNQVLKGAQLGNWMWRSPESHAQGPIEKYSDIFSFGIVCIYAITKRVVLYVAPDEIEEGGELLSYVLERQISYFAESDTLEGLLAYLGDSPWAQVFEVIQEGFGKENPRRPFRLWQLDGIDDDFRDLVVGLTNFDPTKRLTAQQALAHKWFEGA